MVGREHGVSLGLAWEELVRDAAFLDGAVPLESLVQIVIDDEAHAHDAFIIDATNHLDEFGLQLGERAVHVFHGLAILTGV